MFWLIPVLLLWLCGLSEGVQQDPLQFPLPEDAPSVLNTDKYLTRAQKLMKATPMIDGHNVLDTLVPGSLIGVRIYPCFFDFCKTTRFTRISRLTRQYVVILIFLAFERD